MQLTEVITARQEHAFIQVNVDLYASDPAYIRPLDKDIREVFDKKKNPNFREGECARWIVQDDAGRLIGRIAAFTNPRYRNKGDDLPVGGIGFFDCINHQETADLLFDTARQWLQARGMEAMDGPINFGERDRWWGLLVEGFREPLYCMNYNYPYYQALFENYGFKNFFNQYCLGMDVARKLSSRVYERHAAIARDPDYTSAHMDMSNLEKFAEDFTTVYNKAWAGHGGLKTVKKGQILATFKKMKAVMDPRIVWFAYYKKQPVCMFINLPDLNQHFKYLNGKFDLLHKLYFLWLQKIKKNNRLIGMAYGIVPEFQGKGVDSFMLVEAAGLIQLHTHYTDFEMQWIGDFNPKMLNVAKNLGDAFPSRTLITYRYLFDRNREFQHHPVIN